MIEFANWLLANFIWLLSFVVPFLAVLTVIVFVHEMGHYLVARWNGVAIKAFSVGFGRELIGFTDKAGTRWKFCAIPLGGYVRFEGDMNAASVPDHEATQSYSAEMQSQLFVNKSVWQRIAVVAAGPIANIIFTFVVLYLLLIAYGQHVITPIINEVQAGSVAEQAGLQANDTILSVDGYEVRGFNDFQRLVSTSPEREIIVEVQRDESIFTLNMVPKSAEITDRFGNAHRVGQIGVIREIGADDITLFKPSAFDAIGLTLREMQFIIDRTAAFLGDFFVGRGDVEQLGGPVKVAQVSGQVATLGIIALINLAALLSLNIGIFNLLPIPLLDGGHLVYYLYEAIAGRPLSMKIQEFGFRIGVILIGSLMIFTLINDIFF